MCVSPLRVRPTFWLAVVSLALSKVLALGLDSIDSCQKFPRIRTRNAVSKDDAGFFDSRRRFQNLGFMNTAHRAGTFVQQQGGPEGFSAFIPTPLPPSPPVVLDEAQHIKNPGSSRTRSAKAICSDSHFALTGTPLENSLGELWSLFDFILPGYLFSYSRFKNEIERLSLDKFIN